VTYVRDFYARFTTLIHEIAKFAIVGGIGFVIQLGITDGLHLELNVGPLEAVVIGYIVATALTFIGNRHWAFRHRKGNGLGRESIVFLLLNLAALGVQEAIVAFVHYSLGMTGALSYNIALVVGIGLCTGFRVWTYRKWVFLAVPEAPAEVERPQPEPVH
jgi:putative flippase GtrA